MSLEDAERIMDENAEGIAYAEELSDLLSQGLTEEDTTDLMDELEAMANAVDPSQNANWTPSEEKPATSLPDMPAVPIHLPEVPDHEPVVQENRDTEEAMAI